MKNLTRYSTIALVVLCFFCLSVSAQQPAGDVSLAWDAPAGPEPVDGYYLYSTIEGENEVQTRIDGKANTTYTYTAGFFPYRKAVLFEVTAFNTAGEGPRSNYVEWTKADQAPGSCTNLRIP